jgi:S-adenosylmethionine:tRNA ribosyltransferase-isomerase
MKVSDFDFGLPPGAIAQEPVTPRDKSRLLVLRRDTGRVAHDVFAGIGSYFEPGDTLVVNNTRVIPARLFARREGSGATIEVVLLKDTGDGTWEALVRPGRKARPGAILWFGARELKATVRDTTRDGTRILAFEYEGDFSALLDRLGKVPLPPYITREPAAADRERYQTVYGVHPGSVAAPTAGLHFTAELLERLGKQGIVVAPVLLHVGLGTFRPVRTEVVEEHHMHAEFYEVSASTAAAINRARETGKRVVAVGTTSVRTLETAAGPDGLIKPGLGWADIFIYPGYRFRVVDALITNFHLPRSTLLMLVSAFAGREKVLAAYEEAIREGYRFYSYVDAMLIL